MLSAVLTCPYQLLHSTHSVVETVEVLVKWLSAFLVRSAVVEGWLDLAKLVASEGGKQKSPYEDLAYNIGVDQAWFWHTV